MQIDHDRTISPTAEDQTRHLGLVSETWVLFIIICEYDPFFRAYGFLCPQAVEPSMPVVYSRKRLRALQRTSNDDSNTEDPPAIEEGTGDTRKGHDTVCSRRVKTRKRKLVQTYLDVGQADLSLRQCAQCGMVYAPGASDDNLVHARHHARVLRRDSTRISFNGWMGERVVGSLQSGRLVAVKACDIPAWRRRVIEIDAFVSLCLSGDAFCLPPLRPSDTSWLAIFFVVDRSVEAYLLTELVFSAHIAKVSEDGIAYVNTNHPPVFFSLCGVQKVWVASRWRRKGIASAMVDAARVNLLYGHVFPVDRVAFTATTPNGSQFAMSYSKHFPKDRIFIYSKDADSTGTNALDSTRS